MKPSRRRILLNAYYETLYDLLEASLRQCVSRMKQLLVREILRTPLTELLAKGNELSVDERKLAAYHQASSAFLTERLETYNPFGIQYTFPVTTKSEAFALEAQIDWYDSRAEFERLSTAIEHRVRNGLDDTELDQAAFELVREFGAYPNQTIVAAYRAQPTANHLPDYVVSIAIDEVLSRNT